MAGSMFKIGIPNEIESFLSEMCAKKKHRTAVVFTWCNTNGPTNYGQILQCYAVQEILKKYGFTVKVLRFRRKNSSDTYQKYYSNIHESGRKKNEEYEKSYLLSLENNNVSRVEAFEKFIGEYINVTNICYSNSMVEREIKDSDLLVCGSDQIWNPAWSDDVWMLGVGCEKQSRLAFAPSGLFVDDEYTNEFLDSKSKILKSIDLISVRERCGADILKRHLDKDVVVCPDPTLCLSAKQWNAVIKSETHYTNKKYIICYLLGSVRPYQLIIRAIAQKYDVDQVLVIPSNINTEPRYKSFYYVDDAGPSEFLALIKNAEAVCTDSFHGVVFSNIFNTKVYSVVRTEKGADRIGRVARLDNLVNEYGLTINRVESCKDVNFYS